MALSSPVFRIASTTASAAVLAISVGVFPGGPASADSPEPMPATTTSAARAPAECQLLCLPVLGEELLPTEPEDRPRKAKEPAAPPAEPAAPAPAPADQPAAPAAPSAATVPAPDAPSLAPVPEESDAGTAAPEATVPALGPTPSSGSTPSSGHTGASNWNTPVTRSAQATHVAAVSPADGRGTDDAALLPIIAGVLLVGVSGVAFAWWGRNRLRAH